MKRLAIIIILCICTIGQINAQNRDSLNIADTLKNTTINLKEVVVTAPIISQNKYGCTYLITPNLREKVGSPIELLNHINGVKYNELDNTIKVGTDTRVLLLVNGIERELNYIMGLSPARISKIEIINIPAAKYVAEGYKYVINYKLKSDWVGHELYIQNFSMLSPGNNGDNHVANEQPRVQYMLSDKKADFHIGYGYGNINWNYPISYQKSYFGKLKTATVEMGPKNPNDENTNIAHNITAGVDLHISQGHTIAWKADYLNSLDNHIASFDWYDQHARWFKEKQQNRSKDNDFSTSLIYKAYINEKWSLHSAVGYHHIRQNSFNMFDRLNGYHSESRYNNYKNYIRGEVDVIHNINECLSLNAGFICTWNKYSSKPIDSKGDISHINENRQHAYVYLDYYPAPNVLLHAGCGAERISNMGKSWHWLPQISFNYIFSESSQLMIDYSSKMAYPKMYQIVKAPYYLDNYVVFSGNPNLSPSRVHSISVRGTFNDNCMLGITYDYTHNYITDLYGNSSNKIIKTFANANNRSLTGYIAYDWNICENIHWQNVAQINLESVSNGSYRNKFTNYAFNSQLNYWIEPIKMQTTLNYQYNMFKEPLLQGWNNVGQDYWMLSMQKGFWKERIFATVSYIPPLHFGVRKFQKNVVETNFYKYTQRQNLRTFDNMIMIRVHFRFSSGKKRASDESLNFEFESEKKKDKGLL